MNENILPLPFLEFVSKSVAFSGPKTNLPFFPEMNWTNWQQPKCVVRPGEHLRKF